jgi:diaminopimelate epimerase
MTTKFYKYQGTGNDFILIDNRSLSFTKSAEEIERLCHRRFGIGADGLILLENEEGYDFRMVYFNADGNEGSMCGNGGRCIVRFAHDLEIIQESTSFIATDGPHEATISSDLVKLKMMDVTGITDMKGDSFLDTGSPHLIKEVDDLSEFDVKHHGSQIRFSEYWQVKGGVNVNFISYLPDNKLYVRTYERGVEDETYSCGTGVTAAAIHAVFRGGFEVPVNIKTLGGDLSVSFEVSNEGTEITNIYLSGPAKRVFTAEI